MPERKPIIGITLEKGDDPAAEDGSAHHCHLSSVSIDGCCRGIAFCRHWSETHDISVDLLLGDFREGVPLSKGADLVRARYARLEGGLGFGLYQELGSADADAFRDFHPRPMSRMDVLGSPGYRQLVFAIFDALFLHETRIPWETIR